MFPSLKNLKQILKKPFQLELKFMESQHQHLLVVLKFKSKAVLYFIQRRVVMALSIQTQSFRKSSMVSRLPLKNNVYEFILHDIFFLIFEIDLKLLLHFFYEYIFKQDENSCINKQHVATF